MMKRISLTGIALWFRSGGWRGVLGALVAISLLIEPIRTEQPAAGAGGGIQKWPPQQVAAMRWSQGVDGMGVGIGVLSSGVATLLSGELEGDLLDRMTVLPGQAGHGDDGTETLAILHDLAPGGEFYFATGLGGPARFAANIEALCRAGADVIIDDLFDYQETIYQGGLMAQAVKAAVRNGCVYVSAKGNQVKSRVWGGETASDQLPPIPDDLSTTGDSAGSNSDLSRATCVTTANPDFVTFCVSSAPPPQVAAMVALILESAGGFHNTSLEELRAAVTGGGIEPEPMPLNVATGPAVHKIEISSNPPKGRETYGIGDAIEVTVTFSEPMTVAGTPQLGLRVGSLTRSASYSGGAGTPALVFSYTVAEDDEDTDGLSVEADSLSVDNGAIEGGSENAAELNHAGLPDQAGQTVDGVKPSLLDSDAAMASGSTLTLNYDEMLDGSSTPSAEDFRVSVAGERRDVTTVEMTGSIVSLTLASSVVEGEPVTVSYTAPTQGTANPVRDPAGNEAAVFAHRSVVNRTGKIAEVVGQVLSANAVRQIQAVLAAKTRRTPAQRKVSSRLLDAPRSAQGNRLQKKLVKVDIRADVTPAVLDRIRALRGEVVNSVPKYRAIRARLPLSAVETLAELDAVQTIRPASEPIVRKGTKRNLSDLRTHLNNTPVFNKEDTTEGDVAHQANVARQTHSVDGTGIGVGVISDGALALTSVQADGDLPARITVLPGQEGGQFRYFDHISSGTEGTAMLEIVHDLAPGAELYFAAAGGSEAQMAENIEALCAAGADVIVDDIGWFFTPAFQDGTVAQAASEAVDDGCFHFSSAGNFGNKNDGTAGVWEGDYAAGSSITLLGNTVVPHDFGSGVTQNRITKDSIYPFILQWADPWGESENDYDLFLIDRNGNVLESSTDTQNGTQDPMESIGGAATYYTNHTNARLVIVKSSGAADRYLRLNYLGGELETTTSGQTWGHSAAEDVVGVAAVDVQTARGPDRVFNGLEKVETFSSDGPRRIFFEADGIPITMGNFSSTGGKLLQKPDLTAADAVSTSTPGFSTFRGTSAAAPHAAAIAALMLEAAGGPENLTLVSLRTGMTGSALDIEETGVDRDSGAGIVMAPGAVDAVDVAEADRNGAPTVEGTLADRTFSPSDPAVTISLTTVFADPDTDTLTYTALTDTEVLSADVSGSNLVVRPLKAARRVRVNVRATDPEGLSVTTTFTVTIGLGSRDYDVDNDGLIEISTLDQLNAVRVDLDGDGLLKPEEYSSGWLYYYAAFDGAALGMGCPSTCSGYELTATLDFDTDGSGSVDEDDEYWNNGGGWWPIGGPTLVPFEATFNGNGNRLVNLFIDRPNEESVGLFGLFGKDGGTVHKISNVGMANVQVSGKDSVGSLVGRGVNMEVNACYATGEVSGEEDVGGLVGKSDGLILASYADVRVSGEENVGGLVGDASGKIAASYAKGKVNGDESVGGLAGSATGELLANYAAGLVSGQRKVGALIGSGTELQAQFNYWDFQTYRSRPITNRNPPRRIGVGSDDKNNNGFIEGSETPTAGILGQPTAALQSPTSYSGIYANWNLDLDSDTTSDNPWDFGTSAQYPVLSVDFNGNASATWQEFGYQVRTSPTLTATNPDHLNVNLSWTAPDFSAWTPAPSVTYTLTRAETSRFVDNSEIPIVEDTTALSHADPVPYGGPLYFYRVVALIEGGGEVSGTALMSAAVTSQRPMAVGALSDVSLRVGGDAEVVDVSGAFRDPEGDALTFKASSSFTSVATVGVSGSEVTITPVATGRTTITVTAGTSANFTATPYSTQHFTVTVWPKTTVSKLEITSDPGSDATYAIDDPIEVTVTFNQAVEVMGIPQLTLKVGDEDRPANYQAVAGGELQFRYWVIQGDIDTNGVSIEADRLALNGGSIQDGAKLKAELDHRALGNNSRHKVDGVRPALAAIRGAVVDATTLTLTYDETLDSSSTPPASAFSVFGGASTRTVSDVAVSRSAVQLTLAPPVEYWETGIGVNYTPPTGMGAAPVKDRVGNVADGLSGEPVSNETPDRVSPTVTSVEITSDPPDGRDVYGIGEAIEVTVTFDETVTVSGTARVTLKVGERDRSANYESVTGAVVLFAYTVAVNDSDTDGVSIEADSLSGGTIRDPSMNHAVRSHPAVAAETGQKVDGIRPKLATTDGAVANGTTLTLAYSEPLDSSSLPANDAFSVTGGNETRTVTGVRVNGSGVELTVDPAVEHGESGLRVSYTVPTGTGANPIQDTAGNDVDRLSSQRVTNNTGDTSGSGGKHRGNHLERRVGPDLRCGRCDRGDGDVQRDGGGDGDTTADAERGRSESNREL